MRSEPAPSEAPSEEVPDTRSFLVRLTEEVAPSVPAVGAFIAFFFFYGAWNSLLKTAERLAGRDFAEGWRSLGPLVGGFAASLLLFLALVAWVRQKPRRAARPKEREPWFHAEPSVRESLDRTPRLR